MSTNQVIIHKEFAEKALRLGVNERQLERWREASLIPRPRRVSLGRGKGIRSEYPVSAVRNVRAIRRLMTPNDPLWLVGWKLWWRGYDIPDHLALEAVRQSVAEAREKMSSKLEPLLPGGGEQQEEEEFDQARADKAFKQLRRDPFYQRLHRALGPDDFASWVQTLAAISVNDPECQDPELYWPSHQSLFQKRGDTTHKPACQCRACCETRREEKKRECDEPPLTQTLARAVKQFFLPEALAVADRLHGKSWLDSKETAEVTAELAGTRLSEVALTVSAEELQRLRQHLQTFRMTFFLLGGQTALTLLDTVLDSRLSPLLVAGGFGYLARTSWGADGIASIGHAIRDLGK